MDPTEDSDDVDGGIGRQDDDDVASTAARPDTDGGAPRAATVFDKGPAYASTLGQTARKNQHDFAGNTPRTNPAGRPCMQCHGAAGPAPRFAMAGTIYRTGNATQPAPRVEVRVVDKGNRVLSAYTDADGNFFARPPAGAALAFPAKAGARDANTVRSMPTPTMNGNCNSCHRSGGNSTPLVVP